MTWKIDSWQHKPIQQNVTYPDRAALAKTTKKLSELPPLVTAFEINKLKQHLAKAADNKCFLLQGGDCAESFVDCKQRIITNKLRILLQMSLILIHGLRKPVIRVGRIAGQYAKPRSSDTETIDNKTLPSYRGDLINGQPFTQESRIPNPNRMLLGYQTAAITLNFLRALVTGGFADLEHSEYWNLEFAKKDPMVTQYQKIADQIGATLGFIKTIGGDSDALKKVEFFTSHEALHLLYEQALTKRAEDNNYYDFSTHFPWVGMRTANLNEAHIEFLRGIANPVAVKVGPGADKKWLQRLIVNLNPNNEPGRLTLITRMGTEKIQDLLPALIDAQQQTGINVLWSSDPMHGNTKKTQGGYKTRYFDEILSELKQAFAIHKACNSHLGGVHFELTGEDVTECTGGASGVTEADLAKSYHSLVDPRLNYEQALEIAMLIVQEE